VQHVRPYALNYHKCIPFSDLFSVFAICELLFVAYSRIFFDYSVRLCFAPCVVHINLYLCPGIMRRYRTLRTFFGGD
jgi:hypothetical protein